MPRTLPPELLEIVVAVVTKRPGITLRELAQSFDPPVEERTLQRWLMALIDAGRITRTFDGLSARYYAVVSKSAGATKSVAPTPRPVSQLVTPSAFAPSLSPAQLLTPCVRQIILSMLPKVSSSAFLQMQAATFLVNTADRPAFIASVLARLDRLTEADAPTFDVTTEQLTQWKQQYHQDDPAATTPALPVSPRFSFPAYIRNRGFLKGWLIFGAWCWGSAFVYLINEEPLFAPLSLFTVPLLGLPWVLFLLSSRQAYRRPPTYLELIAALLCGGAITWLIVIPFAGIVRFFVTLTRMHFGV